MVHISYTISTRGLPDMYTLSPQACGPWASGVHIRQTTCVHSITITYIITYISGITGYLIVCVPYIIGDTAPHHITQPPTNDHVQIVSPDAVMVSLVNITIPVGMTITWLHNGTIINVLNNTKEGSNNALLIKRGPIPSFAGHYQCVFDDNAGHILRRNITLLILHSKLLADSHILLVTS